MNECLRQLIKINELDLEISRYEPIMEEKRAPIRQKEDEKARYIKEKQDLEQVILDKQNLIVRANEQLEFTSEEMEEYQAKIRECKNEKDKKNLLMEEDLLREKIGGFNNEIAEAEAAIENAKLGIAALDSKVEACTAALVEIRAKCQDEVNAIKKSQDEVAIKKQDISLDMEDRALISLYEKIKKWARNSSVVDIYKDTACGGCFFKLSERALIEVRKGDVTHCPHCGRIIYDKYLYDHPEGRPPEEQDSKSEGKKRVSKSAEAKKTRTRKKLTSEDASPESSLEAGEEQEQPKKKRVTRKTKAKQDEQDTSLEATMESSADTKAIEEQLDSENGAK